MPLPASDPLPEAPPAVIGQIKNIGSWISSLLPQKSTPAQAISVPLQTPASKPDSVLPQPLQTGETIRLLSLPKGQESSLIVRPVAQSPMIFGIPDVGEADTVPPVTVRPGALSTTEAKAVPQTILPKTDVGLSLPSAGNILHSTKGMDLIPESLKPVTAEAAPPQALQASLSSTSLIPDGQATFPPAQTDHFDFRVLKIDTPVPDATGLKKIIATAQPQMPAGAIQAKVEGLTAQNFPVLSLMSPDGSASGFSILPLDLPDLAAGSVLTLMPQTQAHPVSAVLTPSLINPQTLIAPPVAADGPWPVLDDLAQIVRQSDPRAYQSLMQTIIPNAGNSARLPAAALLFISVVASGDIAAWMGEKTIDIIRRAGKGEALNRLSGEMGAIKKSSQEPVSSEWRGITLPMAWQDEIGRMMLYYRHDGGHDNDEEKKERTTRFVFDLNLTKMGPVQIDGFHKSERLDLIIRTKMVLSPDMQKTMRRAYASALENSRLFGEISFQNKAEQFIKIPAAAKDKFRTG